MKLERDQLNLKFKQDLMHGNSRLTWNSVLVWCSAGTSCLFHSCHRVPVGYYQRMVWVVNQRAYPRGKCNTQTKSKVITRSNMKSNILRKPSQQATFSSLCSFLCTCMKHHIKTLPLLSSWGRRKACWTAWSFRWPGRCRNAYHWYHWQWTKPHRTSLHQTQPEAIR